MMSYEGIEAARAKRAAKEVTTGKGRRGRKRKSAALEACKLEPRPVSKSEPEPEVARTIEVPEP